MSKRERTRVLTGVAADWTQFPAHLERALPKLAVESQERLEVGRQWSLLWEGQQLQLDAYVYRADEEDRLSPSRVGGERSDEKVGDLLVEFDFRPDLLWQFKNVTMHLRGFDTGRPEKPTPTARSRLIQLAKVAQAFLEASVVSDLGAVTPRLELSPPEGGTAVLGIPLHLACRAMNVAPEARHLEVRSDGFKNVAMHDSEIIATPERVGTVHLWLSLQNTQNLLRSPYMEVTLQSVRQGGQTPARVQARHLDDARIEEGPGLRLRFDREQDSRECTEVFFIPLDEQRSALLQFGGPRYSSAPLSIAMKLQKAFLLDGARTPVRLGPSELHIDRHRYPGIRGVISWASQDWEIASVATGASAGSSWMEELRRRGVETSE